MFNFFGHNIYNFIKYKKLNEYAKEPTRGSTAAAGYDLYAAISESISIPAGETKLISTGLAIACPKNQFVGIFARSGLSIKQGLRPANCVGVIDADYRGEVMVALHNDSVEERIIQPGDRIAQLILLNYNEVEFVEVEDLDDTERGTGGFGSTGK